MVSSIFYENDASGVGVITVQRPAVRNALDRNAMMSLSEVMARAAADEGLRALIITGAGTDAFIAGGDLLDLHQANTDEDAWWQATLMGETLTLLAGLPVPVIAAMEGATRGGGCEVALACDLRIAAENASFGFAQINLAVTPGWGGAERLFNLVGYSRAMDLLLTGRVFDAREAAEMGFINYLCPAGKALHMARMLAERVASGPTLAVRGVKKVLRGYLTLPAEEARSQEQDTFVRLWSSADHREASTAFVEKREPDFSGE